MRRLGMYVLLIILLCSGTVYAASVTVNIDANSPTYSSSGASGVGLSNWEIWVKNTEIKSISVSESIENENTDATGSAVLNLTDGTYFVGAVYFNKNGTLYAPIYMGVYNDSNGNLILSVPGNDTINISDFSKAGAVRGYVKDENGAGISGAKVSVINWPNTIPSAYSTYLNGYSITTNSNGYYSIFLPVETNETTTFTLEISGNNYNSKTFNVNVTQGMGANSSEFEDNTSLSPPPTPPPYSGGGGGGGGTPSSFGVWIRDVLKGQTIELDIDDDDIPYINGVSLTAKQDIFSSKLSITDYDKKPYYSMEEPDAGVSRYFKVSYTKNTYIEGAKLRVSANKSWLEDNDIDPDSVLLYRYTTSWGELDTEILKEDDENIYFEASTPGFSYFSIGGEIGSGYKPLEEEEEEVSPTPVEEETEPAESPEIETPTTAPPTVTLPPEPAEEQEPAKAPDEEKGGICGPTTILIIMALSLLAIRGRYKR